MTARTDKTARTKGNAVHPSIARGIARLGQDISRARRARRISTTDMAARMGVGRSTLHRLEQGDPGVSLNTLAMALSVLELFDRLAELVLDRARKTGREVPGGAEAVEALSGEFPEEGKAVKEAIPKEEAEKIKAQVEEALKAGADFLVAPTLDAASVSTAHAAGVLMAPGVGTPTEALTASNLGCKLLKFFPAGALGINYFKAMRGPLNHLDFTCNGHMHVGNIADFLQAGATACGVAGDGLAGNGSRPLPEIKAIAADIAAVVRSVTQDAP